ncbi:MAG: cupin domain-containing protein [Pseudomonadota bacterium]
MSINLFVALAMALTMSAPPRTAPAEVTRLLLERIAVPGTQMEQRLYLITYPPGATAPIHDHPVDGIGYIVSGEAESAFDGEEAHRLRAGEGFLDPGHRVHRLFRNASADQPLVFLVCYVIAPGEAAMRPLPQ